MDPFQEYERLLNSRIRKLQEDSEKNMKEQIKTIKRRYKRKIRLLKIQIKEYCNVSQKIMIEFRKMQAVSTRLKLDNINLNRTIRLLERRRIQENNMYKQCVQQTINDEIAGQREIQEIRRHQDRILDNQVSPEHNNEERNLESGSSPISSNDTESSE